MNYSFHPAARNEFAEAASFYEECQEGLSLDFSSEFFWQSKELSISQDLGQNSLKILVGASRIAFRLV